MMPEPQARSLVWSFSLVAGGLILLALNFGLLDAYTPWPQVVLAAVFAAAASGFFVAFARDRQQWWRLLPAWTLAALSSMVLTSYVADFGRALIAAQVFAGLALAFGNIYLLARQERWWAILPGGFMFVLAVVVGASRWIGSVDVLAAVLFGGLGLVFYLLYWLDRKRRQWWALIPGSVLLVFGALALASTSVQDSAFVRWWPLVLVAAGLLVWAAGRRTPRPVDKLEINSAPRPRTGRAPASSPPAVPASRPALGEYTQPAPGATIEIIPDND